MAFKFEAPQAVSEILDIDVQVGRTGRITPVARIKPVWIAGTTVSNVTLHNQDYINSLDVAIGDTVAVSRHGDVIPAVDEVIEKMTKETKHSSCLIPALFVELHLFRMELTYFVLIAIARQGYMVG